MSAQVQLSQKIAKRYFQTTPRVHIINKEALKFGYIFMDQINTEWANL